MALSTAIYTLLSADANITTAFSTRIFAALAPMDTVMPFMTYEIGNIFPTIAIGDINSWDDVDVTVTVVGTKHSDVETYAGYVRSALDGYTGTVDSEYISSIVYNGQQPGYDADEVYSSSPQGIAIFTRELNFTLIRIS